MRIPDHLLDDKIRQTKNYELYDAAYNAGKVGLTQEEDEPLVVQTRSRRGGKAGSSGSTTTSR